MVDLGVGGTGGADLDWGEFCGFVELRPRSLSMVRGFWVVLSEKLCPAGGTGWGVAGNLVAGGTGGAAAVALFLESLPVIFPHIFWKTFFLGGACVLGRTRWDCMFLALGRSCCRMDGIS